MRRVDLPTLLEEIQLAITTLRLHIPESRNPERGEYLSMNLDIHDLGLRYVQLTYPNMGYGLLPKQDKTFSIWHPVLAP